MDQTEITKLIIVSAFSLGTSCITIYIKKYITYKNKRKGISSKEEKIKDKLLNTDYLEKIVKPYRVVDDYEQRTGIRVSFEDIAKIQLLAEKLDLVGSDLLVVTSKRISFTKKKIEVRLNKWLEIYMQYICILALVGLFIYTYSSFISILNKETPWLISVFYLVLMIVQYCMVFMIVKNLLLPWKLLEMRRKISRLSKKDRKKILNTTFSTLTSKY